ncbi:hypothetical protein GPN2_10052 [Streptomyces murinus]
MQANSVYRALLTSLRGTYNPSTS